MLGIGLDERVEQHPRMLDDTNLHVRFEDDVVEGSKITFGVNRDGGAIRREASGGSGDLENGEIK